MIQQLSNLTNDFSSRNANEPVVICAADDNYARSLTVTLHSAVQHLRTDAHLHAIILDGGISETGWQAIAESLANTPINLYSIRPDLQQVQSLNISHHITHTAYLRLLAGRLLPESIRRAIYFDSDLLIQDDICKLWQLNLGDDFAMAVPDIACPYVDARHADCNYRKSSPYFSALSPIRNWRELKLDPSAYYFNSGMMILNIERMREEAIERRLLECLKENQPYVWCWDQYALNVVFAGHWRALPLHWNVGSHIFEYPDESFSPFHVEDFLQAKQRPSIIHYTTEWKPWDYQNQHPLRDLFFAQLDQTAWRGWRPSKPKPNFRKSWDAFWAEVIKQSYIRYQKLSAGFRRLPGRPANQLSRIWLDETKVDSAEIAMQSITSGTG